MAVDDDPPGRIETEPGAMADILGGEEGIEDPVAQLAGDPRSVVGDLHLGAVSVQPGAQGDRALLTERIDRVVDQVGPDLVELGPARDQRRQGGVVITCDRDLGVLELVSEDRDRRLQALVHIDLDLGMRWSAISIATASPRVRSSASSASASSPEAARMIRKRSPKPRRRSRATAASTAGSSSTATIAGRRGVEPESAGADAELTAGSSRPCSRRARTRPPDPLRRRGSPAGAAADPTAGRA